MSPFIWSGFWNPLFFPRYRTHAPENAAVEYLGYAKRLPTLRFHKVRDKRVVEEMIGAAKPFYVLPLQMSADAQIRDHSRFKDMLEVIELVIESFARHAPIETKLVIKNHPLDLGLMHYSRVIRRLAARFDLAGRVVYLETGDLDRLLGHALGTVTVNSTAGALSLALNCPVIALGNSIYNLPDLTYQGKLADFWQDHTRPDVQLFKHFRNTVIHTTQVNGGFYSRQGIRMTVENAQHLLVRERSPLEELL